MADLNDRNRSALRVDLTTGEWTRNTVDPEVYQRFLGGRGFNQYHLAHSLRQETLPLDPDRLLLLGAGLLSGTEVPGAAPIRHLQRRAIASRGIRSDAGLKL